MSIHNQITNRLLMAMPSGVAVTGTIEKVPVVGRLSRDSGDRNTRLFFCQNVKSGSRAHDLFGYRYSWVFDVTGEPDDPLKLSAEVIIESITIDDSLPDTALVINGSEVSFNSSGITFKGKNISRKKLAKIQEAVQSFKSTL